MNILIDKLAAALRAIMQATGGNPPDWLKTELVAGENVLAEYDAQQIVVPARLRMVCAACDSEDVLCDAYARWDLESQTWVLAQTFDKGAYCNNCEGECRIDEVTIQPH